MHLHERREPSPLPWRGLSRRETWRGSYRILSIRNQGLSDEGRPFCIAKMKIRTGVGRWDERQATRGRMRSGRRNICRRVCACLREAPMATISELARKLSITRRTAAKYFHEWMDRLLEHAPAQMAASEPVASARTAMASDAGIAAPASFIAYIPAPWGELGSVCAGRTEDNRVGARGSSPDSITSTFLLLCRWLYAKLYPETSTSTSHYGKDEEAWQT